MRNRTRRPLRERAPRTSLMPLAFCFFFAVGWLVGWLVALLREEAHIILHSMGVRANQAWRMSRMRYRRGRGTYGGGGDRTQPTLCRESLTFRQ